MDEITMAEWIALLSFILRTTDAELIAVRNAYSASEKP